MIQPEIPLIAPVNSVSISQIEAMDRLSQEPAPIRVVVGGVHYEVGFNAGLEPLFVRMLNWRADGIKQIYTSKTLWTVANAEAPSLMVDAVIQQARRRLRQQMI